MDATCPFVKRIHKIVEKESAAGRQIVIIGNAGHPEVEGIQGWSVTPAIVIESEKKHRNSYLKPGKSCVLCRRRHLTTINFKN